MCKVFKRIAMTEYTNDYLLNLKVKIFQPVDGYRASTDAVLLSSLPHNIKNGDKILDVGSGTGAISLCLAHRLHHHNVQINGLEIQPQLAELSNLSSKANGFANFLSYFNADISKRNIPVKPCSFQHVITNPPYSAADMKSPNKSKSLAHNFEQLDLESWIKFCLKMLTPFGYFYTINRAEALPEIMHALHHRAGEIQIIPVYSKEEQNAKRVIVCARKDSKAPSIIHPGFIVHDPDGSYTSQAEKILREGQDFITATN